MNTVDAISVSRLSTNELVKCAKGIDSIVEHLLEESGFIKRNTEVIKNSLVEIANIDNRELTKEETEEITALDDKLDTLLPITQNALESNVNSGDFFPEKADASEAFLNAYAKRNRKDLFYGSYSAQGREVSALIQEIFAPENDQNRLNSGCVPYFDAINDIFSQLNTLLDKRRRRGNLPTTLKEQKGILRYRIERIISYVDANILDNVEGFSALQTPLNELITEVMAEYKARMTRKKNAEA